jgi:hypothetical protein
LEERHIKAVTPTEPFYGLVERGMEQLPDSKVVVLVDLRGLEPLTSTLPERYAASVAVRESPGGPLLQGDPSMYGRCDSRVFARVAVSVAVKRRV